MNDDISYSFEWDILVPDVGEVWLRGEDATGYPTQTWLNGELLRHEPAGEFAWDEESGVPGDIAFVDAVVAKYDPQTACFILKGLVDSWSRYIAKTDEFPIWFIVRQVAYTHYTTNLMDQIGCER